MIPYQIYLKKERACDYFGNGNIPAGTFARGDFDWNFCDLEFVNANNYHERLQMVVRAKGTHFFIRICLCMAYFKLNTLIQKLNT